MRHNRAVDIVDERTHRVLAYISALNQQGYRPGSETINEFGDGPDKGSVNEPGGLAALVGLSSFYSDTMGRSLFGGRRKETYTAYLKRVKWLEVHAEGGLTLTRPGKALLKFLNSPQLDDTSSDIFEIVLDPTNPFAYAQALQGLSGVERALLVDPYFRLEQLMDIHEYNNIERVLIGENLKANQYDLLATGLAMLPNPDQIEIRKAPGLHDRYVIPSESGAVLMLGGSLGGVGKKVSTMTSLGELGSKAIRDTFEGVWNSAERVQPKARGTLPARVSDDDTQEPPAIDDPTPPQPETGE